MWSRFILLSVLHTYNLRKGWSINVVTRFRTISDLPLSPWYCRHKNIDPLLPFGRLDPKVKVYDITNLVVLKRCCEKIQLSRKNDLKQFLTIILYSMNIIVLLFLGQQGSYARWVHQLHNGRPRPHGWQQRRGSPSHPRT